MRSTATPDCCGAVLFSGFGGSLTVGTGDVLEEEINKWLDTNEAHQRKAMQMSTVIITLNDAQMAKIGHVFKDRGYKFSEPMFHNKHRTRLFVGYLSLQEDPGVDVVPMFEEGKNKPASYGLHIAQSTVAGLMLTKKNGGSRSSPPISRPWAAQATQ